jgi:hypothetical protein
LRRKDSIVPPPPPFDGISNRQRVSSVTEFDLQKVIPSHVI